MELFTNIWWLRLVIMRFIQVVFPSWFIDSFKLPYLFILHIRPILDILLSSYIFISTKLLLFIYLSIMVYISRACEFMKLMWRHFSLQAIFPLSFLFSNSLKFPAKRDDILKQYEFFPKLSVQNPSLNSKKGPRRVHLELYLGWVDHGINIVNLHS